jgi:Fe-S cluster biosynthesis and repair protein YggX
MTNELMQQKFGELIYMLGEIDFQMISSEAWDKYINQNQPFNETQLKELREWTKDLLAKLTNHEYVLTSERTDIETWNYKVVPVIYSQEDWNETIVVRLMKLSVKKGGNINVTVPNKFKQLIESLKSYNPITKKIHGRFNITFVNDDSNIIMVGDEELEILNFK